MYTSVQSVLFSAFARYSFILKIQSYKNSPELRTRLAASVRKKINI